MRHKHDLSCLEGKCPSPGRKKKLPIPAAPMMTGEKATQRILHTIDDEELTVDSFRIRMEYAPHMSSPQIGSLIHTLDRRLKTEASRSVDWNRASARDQDRAKQNIIWRLNTAIRGLREALSDRQKTKSQGQIAADAAHSAATGQETCKCGQRHPYGANFYVSVQDAGKTGLLRGPFRTHAQAISAVPATKKDAEARDSFASFYAFGTVAMPRSYKKPGLLDRKASP